jgi:hypothetical protein
MTIPLTTALNTSDPNRTLGCGYLDETDQIFKNDGVTISTISSTLVTCLTTHLTAFGVEEYTSDVTTTSSSSDNIVPQASVNSATDTASTSIGNSWAIYVCIIMLIMMAAGFLWTYRKDKRDHINYSQGLFRSDKDKLYLGVYLEPIIVARKDKKETDKLMATVA